MGSWILYGARACHLCTLVSQSRGDHVCLFCFGILAGFFNNLEDILPRLYCADDPTLFYVASCKNRRQYGKMLFDSDNTLQGAFHLVTQHSQSK